MVMPDSVAGRRFSRGVAMVIGGSSVRREAWGRRRPSLAKGRLALRAVPAGGCLLELDSPDDRDSAGQSGGLERGQHRHGDPEDGREGHRQPGQLQRDRQPSGRYQAEHQHAGDEAGETTQDRADDAEYAGYDDDHAPDLAARHADGPQDADLPDSLEYVHGQGVHDAQSGHDHGDHRQGVEQAKDLAKRVADGALYPLERSRLEGKLASPRLEHDPARFPRLARRKARGGAAV